MRVIVTGGGTGGHIYPALAIAKGILARNPQSKILYVGTSMGMEAWLVPQSGLTFKGISGQGLPRKLSLDLLKAGIKSLKAVWETKQILKEFKPDLVVGTGGYVSGPVVLTAALFGVPAVLHEQNAKPGITNTLLARFVRKVMVTFPESIESLGVKDKVILTGLPVRSEIGKISRGDAARRMGLDPQRLTLLVTGGSRGARSINQAMGTVLAKLQKEPEIQLLWATGTQTYQETCERLREAGVDLDAKRWRVIEYIEDMPSALACADLYIGRSGAASLAELMVAGLPSILIPYPFAAENHQEANARSLEKGGAAVVIPDSELNGEKLWLSAEKLLQNPTQLQVMSKAARTLARSDALDKIVEICLKEGWH